MAEHDNLRALRYLEDLRVGERFVSGTYQLDNVQIKAFAEQFDPQPFHLDEASARNSFFGGLAASGWHTAAITMRLLTTTSAMRFAGGMIGAGVELNWPKPTRPGDVLQVESEIVDIKFSRSNPHQGFALLKVETLNQKGEAVQEMKATLLVFRRLDSNVCD